jgi:hypothetical protein
MEERVERKRLRDTLDSEHWFCVCFKTRDDKEAFLKKHGIDSLGDKYIDGYKADELLSKE